MGSSDHSAPTFVRFIILSDARTGSNMLADALDSHPRIVCFREIFNFISPDHIDYRVEGYNDRDAEDAALRASDPVEFLHQRIFCQHSDRIAAVGFKFHYAHFWGYSVLNEHLVADRELRVVHLKRRNLLRSVVSSGLARKSGVWFEPTPRPLWKRFNRGTFSRAVRSPGKTIERLLGRTPPRPRLRLASDECVRRFREVERLIAHYDEMFGEHRILHVYYEDFLSDRDAAFDRIQDFLGVEQAQLMVGLQRQNPEPLRELVTNYDELRSALADTRYAAFLDDE